MQKYHRPELEVYAKRAKIHSFNTKKPIHESIIYVSRKGNLTSDDISDIMDLIINWEIDSINEKHRKQRKL